jgi:hypothetical protein
MEAFSSIVRRFEQFGGFNKKSEAFSKITGLFKVISNGIGLF